MAEASQKEKEAKEKEIKEKKEDEIKKEEPKEKEIIEAKKEEKIEKEKPKEEEKKKEEKPEDAKDLKIGSLFKRKPLKLLLLLLQEKNWYPSLLARESGQSYVHTIKILGSLEDIGLITSEFNGKKKSVKLTEKGEKAAKSLDDIIKSL